MAEKVHILGVLSFFYSLEVPYTQVIFSYYVV